MIINLFIAPTTQMYVAKYEQLQNLVFFGAGIMPNTPIWKNVCALSCDLHQFVKLSQ
jgi:hypothetical protein